MSIRIPDIFVINKWKYKQFSILITSVLLLYDIIYLIKFSIRYNIPIAQEILGFLLITFLPGFCILRILKVNSACRLTNLLFAIGLSLSSIVLLGFVINLILPVLGINQPMNSRILVLTLNIFIVSLVLISSKTYNTFTSYYLELKTRHLTVILALSLVIFISIFSSYLVTYYNYYNLTLLCIIIISIIPTIVIYNKTSEYLYPYTIFTIALSILFVTNLITTHLWSFDIFFEAYSTRAVIRNGVWIPSLRYKANSLLLITILAPTYSLICNLSYIWVFKIIFPIIFSFTPIALYQLYQNYDLYIKDYKVHIDETLAFLSSILFIFYYGFFKNMPDKQYIAELFLVLIIISLTNILKLKKYNNQIITSIIMIVITFALITTHYGVSYMFMIALFLIAILLYILRLNYPSIIKNYTLFYTTLVMGWYIYAASGNKYYTIISLAKHIVEKLLKSQTPTERSGISYVLHKSPSYIWFTFKLIYITLQIFILIGVICLAIYTIRKKRIYNIAKYIFLDALSLVFYTFLLVQIIITYGMGFDRVLQITLILLSPLALLGSIYMIYLLENKLFKVEKNKISFDVIIKNSKIFFALFLLIFMLFNSGFVFKISNNRVPPYCIAINKSAGWPVYTESEVTSMTWLKSHGKAQYGISIFNMWHIIKSRDGTLASEFYSENNIISITPNMTRLPHNTYIYLGKISIKKVKTTGLSKFGGYIRLNNTKFYSKVLTKSQRVYTCRDTRIYIYERV